MHGGSSHATVVYFISFGWGCLVAVTLTARWTYPSCATRYRLTVRYWAGLKAFGLKWFTIFTKAAYNMRFGIMAAGRWSHLLFVRCCAAALAGHLLFGFGFYHQHFYH